MITPGWVISPNIMVRAFWDNLFLVKLLCCTVHEQLHMILCFRFYEQTWFIGACAGLGAVVLLGTGAVIYLDRRRVVSSLVIIS